MRSYLFLFCIIMISCNSSDNKKSLKIKQESVKIDNVIKVDNIKKEPIESPQDSLRTLLLNSKPNHYLKSSMLKELYLRGLVDQVDDNIEFKLPFNIHGFDCGSPDCYTTFVEFSIKATNPLKMPQNIDFRLSESGCYTENNKPVNGTFKLIEESSNFVNYYSSDQKSHLIILEKEERLYYFPNTQPNSIRITMLNEIFEGDIDEESPNAPYQSYEMYTYDYERFIEKN